MKKLLLISIIFLIYGFTTSQNIYDISTEFCNSNKEQKTLDFITTANQTTDICVNFTNKSNVNIPLEVDFVDWVLTPSGDKACFSSEKPKPNFGKHMLNFEKNIIIPANSTKQQIYQIKIPTWFSGVSHWCLAYNIQKEDIQNWWVSLVFRQTHSIDILVWWIEVDSKIKINNSFISWNNLILQTENNGNIEQEITINSLISNIFWYNYTTETITKKIKAKNTENIKLSITKLPSYKWLFQINTNISYKPIFDFDITNQDIKTEYTTPWSINIKTTTIIRDPFYTTVLIIILLLLVIISIILIKPKKK